MIPLLTYPLALAAALAIPALVAIYFFRNRFKRHSVAGLFLWEHAMRAREGGTIIRRMRISGLFILELLALLALILAATDPRLPYRDAGRSVVVILDDSASMRAGSKGRRPHDLALPSIRKIIRNGQFKSVRFMLAGQQPTLMDVVHDGHWQDASLTEQWKCQAASSDLDAAIAMASELTARQSQLLVITDHAQSSAWNQNTGEVFSETEQGHIEWHAFGTPLANLGFINARRSINNGMDRLFLAIGNYSENNIALTVPVATSGQIIKTLRLEIASGGSKSAAITLPPDCGSVTMQLPRDALAIDNAVTLLPESPRQIGVRISVTDERLRHDLEAAIAATGLRDALAPSDLTITDSGKSTPSSWELQLIHAEHPTAYTGPFVADYNNPLAHGLDFDGVVWGASPTNIPSGNPVILAGNIPLLTEQILASNRRIFRMQIAPKTSNIQTTPAWPALIWNIAKLRSDALPGTERINMPVGSAIYTTLPDNLHQLTVTSPDKTQKIIYPKEKNATIATPIPGIYRLTGENFNISLAVNFTAPAESNLRNCQKGSWGNWHNRETLMREYRSFAWISALVALLLLAIHTVLTAKQNRNEELTV